VGQHVVTFTELPPLEDEGQLILILEEVLETREKKLRNRSIKEYLIKWKDIPIEDTNWEGEHIFQHPGLQLLEDKLSQVGRTVISPLS
jgi:hypothetical protein